MTGYTVAQYNFWSQFGIPAYQQGQVPEGAEFPYVTYEVIEGAPFGRNVLTAKCWFAQQEGESVNADVSLFLDDVKRAIPPQGIKLSASDGFFVLSPNNAGFLSIETDPDTLDDGRTIVTGRISYEITYYL